MQKRAFSGLMLTLLLICTSILIHNVNIAKATPRTWTVDDDRVQCPTADFTSIQGAIYAASSGDTIYVYNGTYYEHMYISTSLTLVGENKYGTIIDGSGYGSAFISYMTSRMRFTGFTIRNFERGFELHEYCDSVTITGNLIANASLGGPYWGGGVFLDSCSKCIVANNTIVNTPEVGVFLEGVAYGNVITNNTMSGTTQPEIYVGDYNHDNTVLGNIISNSTCGIYVSDWSYSNNILDNNISNLTYAYGVPYGIIVWSPNNKIADNKISNVEYTGIRLNSPTADPNNCIHNVVRGNVISNTNEAISVGFASSFNSIIDNNVSHCNIGLGVGSDSNNNTFRGNVVSNNNYGIFIWSSSNNEVYHNDFLGNTQQVLLSEASNTLWDDGYPSGGNHWSDYVGVDFYSGQYQNEIGLDGIGDTAYIVDGSNQDNYPLMNSWSQPWGNWEHYHDYIETVRVLLYLNETYPDLVDVFSIGKSWEGRDIYCIKLTNESNTHPKPQLLFVGYHHAREFISAELPLYFAAEASSGFGTNTTITRMLNYSEIYIVPMLNVDAFNVAKQNEWQRKNVHPIDDDGDGRLDEDPPQDVNGNGYIEDLIRWDGSQWVFVRWEGIDHDGDGLIAEDWVGGVDINRNYGYQWDASCYSGSPIPSAEDYRGSAPFSEPETQAIRDLALGEDFKYAISFHSGSESIGYPWGYTTSPTSDDAVFREVASNLSALVGAPNGQNSYMYTMSGSWDDWLYANRSTKALTCEIYTNSSAWQYEPGPEPDTLWERGVFQFFNPDPTDIETVVQRWLPAFFYTTNRAITEAYDVATSHVNPLKTVVGQGYVIRTNITLTNKGDFAESFRVTLYANTAPVKTSTVTVASKTSATVTLTWNTTGFAKGNYTMSAYAWPIPGEERNADNLLLEGWILISTPGDINGDKKVNLVDVFAVAKAFGANQGQPKYNPYLDLNDDGKINLVDYFATCKNFNKPW